MTATARELETQFFLTLNSFVEPWVRAGVGSPGIVPTGLVVLETTGRRSGAARKTPLAATLIEGHLLLSTVRGNRSQWIRNAIAEPAVRFWLHGKERRGHAMVHSADWTVDPSALPPLLAHLVTGPMSSAISAGWAFAIIKPDPQ